MKKRLLSEKQERLLMCYHDEACSWFGGIRARRLLAISEAAREYAQSLEDISTVMSSPAQMRSGSVQLWQGVVRRIEQEERAAMYLGKRIFADRTRSKAAARDYSFFKAGVPVAAIGALAVAFLMLPVQEFDSANENGARLQTVQQGVSERSPQQGFVMSVAANNPVTQPSASLASASLASAGQASSSNLALSQSTPVPQYGRSQDPWEVEWIRSDGRVRMIPHRAGRAPILWINRQESFGRLHGQEVHRLQDGSELRILEKTVPQAITVSDE